ncbi:MAG: zinc ribbon domain-containing protein [Streptococcaceae bacterium]|jgi:hypothetical protein|nr:zinc ribbon domain-containing protein [Streptococcaceae bacterium]
MKKKMCQSCGMPLETAEDYGTEKNGAASADYCQHCYQEGEWVEPDMTLAEVIKKGHEAIDAMQVNRFKRALMKKGCSMMMPKLKRWANV